MPPKPEFPMRENKGGTTITNDQITFTYFNSKGTPVTETKPVLNEDKIIKMVGDRRQRFLDAPPGSRESETSRSERKYIMAHSIALLRRAWDRAPKDVQTEMAAMMSPTCHGGTIDAEDAKEDAEPVDKILGDDRKPMA